jgi:hypothetical protein
MARVLYIARHGNHDNCDEDAITYALTKLGHEVRCIPERCPEQALRFQSDMVLVHKLYGMDVLKRIKTGVKVFWHFDMVESDDWELQARTEERKQWMKDILQLVDLGLCTDGDQVAKDTTGKLRWLMQGADERFTGPAPEREQDIGLLFTGSVIHGGKRISHIRELQERYGDRFKMVGHHARERVHGRKLAELIARAKIVVAPDGPVTPAYWSNRAYLTLGFGGFLFHPYCQGLTEHYEDGEEIVLYQDRVHFHELVAHYLDRPDERRRIAENGYKRTMAEHTYFHRCQHIVEMVENVVLTKERQ